MGCGNQPREAEDTDQSWVAERDDPADADAGHGEHHHTIGLVGPVLVTDVAHGGGLAVGAGRQQPPATRRSQHVVRRPGTQAPTPWNQVRNGVASRVASRTSSRSRAEASEFSNAVMYRS